MRIFSISVRNARNAFILAVDAHTEEEAKQLVKLHAGGDVEFLSTVEIGERDQNSTPYIINYMAIPVNANVGNVPNILANPPVKRTKGVEHGK